jgi:hypothetical protein
MHENRETSGVFPASGDRSGKAKSRTPDMYAPEESDRAVIPMKLPNKEAQASAEVVEGRARTKENTSQSHTSPAQYGKWRVPGFGRCAPCFDLTPSSEVRAVCGNAARTDPRGGRSAMAVPTATLFSPPFLPCHPRPSDPRSAGFSPALP